MNDHRYADSPRRSILFMPGDSLRKISKAAHMEVDSIVMDMEDGVALNRKEEARRTIREALRTLDFGGSECLVRLNPIGSGHFTADLEATAAACPDGYVLPKVETAEQMTTACHALTAMEETQGRPPYTLKLLAIIETARGVMNLKEIAGASPRLEALMFGAEDLAGDMGAERTRAGWEIFYARSAVVTAAAAYDLHAIDMIFTDLNDLEGLEEEGRFACRMGYTGKMAIHPRQIPVIHAAFAPSQEDVDRARRLIHAHETHQATGTGAFNFEGTMVDLPLVHAAEHVLAQARLAGMLE
ncbi:MAG TPA: CoA ester lyase [Candidatus Latescibacteria bacterium]|nr:CoA ester lyase [Candidatus Latescibacterota bacterium]